MPFQFCNQRCVCLKPSYRICIKLNQILLLPTTQGVSKPIAATVCLINYICYIYLATICYIYKTTFTTVPCAVLYVSFD